MSITIGEHSSPAPPLRRIFAQARFDAGNVLRNGENLLLTFIIPVAAVILILKTPFGADREPSVVLATGLSLAVLASAFTSQAITTGFDRRYGVLRMLGLSPLGSAGLIAARVLVSLVILIGQVVVLTVTTGLLSGWWPTDPWLLVRAGLGLLLAVWAYTALALLLAGTLRAEATLAAANAVFLLLMFAGGLVIPAASLPWSGLVSWLPTGALLDLLTGSGGAGAALAVLTAWAVVSTIAAARSFRWED